MKIKHGVLSLLIILSASTMPIVVEACGSCGVSSFFDNRYCCPQYYRYNCCNVRVECVRKPAHWIGMHWIPASNVCWYR
jgi:hypothetical protein